MTLQESLVNEIRDSEGLIREKQRLLALRYQVGLNVADPRARLRTLETLADGRAPALPLMVSVGDALVAAGQLDEASVLWERALRSTPRTVLVERLASIASEAKHRERLRTVLRKLRSEQVNPHAVHLLTARLYVDDGNVEAGAQELETLGTGENTPALWNRLWTEIHRKRGQIEQALAVASQPQAADQYACKTCNRASKSWIGYCPNCHDWDSYRSSVEISSR